MKYLKLFENQGFIQQPFYLRFDKLLISDDFAFYLKNNVNKDFLIEKNKDFFDNTMKTYQYKSSFSNEYKEFTTFKEKSANLDFNINYNKQESSYLRKWIKRGTYSMRIFLNRSKNRIEYLNTDSGKFRYFISGNSGDFNMHQQGMIIASRNVNYNLMCKYFPIFGYIKNSYKKLKDNQLFFEIIENGLKNGDYYDDINDIDIDNLIYKPKEIDNYSYIYKYFRLKKYNL